MKMVAQAADVDQRERATARRRVRLAAQSVLWRESSLKAVRGCGRSVAGATVGLRVSEGHAGFAGLQTCGSVWACPVCSAKILGHRQGEVAQAVTNWQASGGTVAFATFTVRHHARQSAAQVWDLVSAAHAGMTAGAGWVSIRARWGLERSRKPCPAKSCGQDSARGRRHAAAGTCQGGWVINALLPWLRVVEVTHGAAGWHVHVHMVLFLPPASTQESVDALYASMWQRWNASVIAAGGDAGKPVNHAVLVGAGEDALASYVTKNTYSEPERAALEVARGDLKEGRLGNRSAMQILRDLILQPEGSDPLRDARLWAEYEQASHGRRQMTWAQGARVVLGLDDVELSDEEIAAEETGTEEDTVLALTFEGWSELRRIPGRRAELLEAAERDPGSARRLLDRWGIPWMTPDEARSYAWALRASRPGQGR